MDKNEGRMWPSIYLLEFVFMYDVSILILWDEYEKLCKKIEDAVRNLAPLDFSRDYVDFARIDSRNHPTIIKVIWDAKERISNGLPHLVYVTREKRPNHSHHYKAGAMNALSSSDQQLKFY